MPRTVFRGDSGLRFSYIFIPKGLQAISRRSRSAPLDYRVNCEFDPNGVTARCASTPPRSGGCGPRL